MRLPGDLVDFLKSGKRLDYEAGDCECGAVQLLAIKELDAEDIAVEFVNYFPAIDDPHEDEDGSYMTLAVNLVETCEDYEPSHVLSWFPEIGSFGSYDIDEGHINLFTGATWTDIAKNPVPYLNAQWRDDPGVVCKRALPSTPGIRWVADDE